MVVPSDPITYLSKSLDGLVGDISSTDLASEYSLTYSSSSHLHSSHKHSDINMRLLSTIGTLLLTVSTVVSASVDDVYNDITVLDQDVQALTSMVRGYQGGLIAQGPLLLQLTKVHIATRKGGYDASTLPTTPLSENDALRLIEHVNTTLSVDNSIAVDVLKSKKPLFGASGTVPFIKAGLQILLDDHLYFSNEVLERAPQDLIAEANQVVDVISNALQGGIAAFS
jgi:hypothetical protein